MTAFERAWNLLKQDSPTELRIETCGVCGNDAVVAELELPYARGSEMMCKKCWKDEMDWRLRQQREEKDSYNPDLEAFGRIYGIPESGRQPLWPPHMVPLIPWPYDSDELEGME